MTLVVADSRYIAEDAAEVVDIGYEPLPAAAGYAAAGTSGALVHEGYPGNLAGQLDGVPWETPAEVYDGANEPFLASPVEVPLALE